MKYTQDKIELIDKVFNAFVDYHVNKINLRNKPNEFLLSKSFNIDKDTIQFAINEMCKVGQQLDFLTAAHYDDNSYSIIDMDKVKCLTFQSQGGFIKYFNDLYIDKNLSVNQNINIGDNYGQVINANHSSFKNFENNLPAINPKEADKKSIQKILLSIASWIFKNIIVVIIVGLIIAYLIYRFGWEH
jgi:uncharacterized Fe-S cluster protein YjdI